ncbi:hypothetical protein RSOLAG1IB_09334 [Rhizoctonia solani AG-1 IB]|uniref:F-box domain-containing protein n=1 Tax=Thanatephorus cucumeris (strain AG1-IB / isolate 7/3/14) TaxID=1108050 RepID=A0A0B7FQ67_THACB|nr:hypothetical protein RSOLAG1IB_09334 [Rhizoctonia solani AG-1 IB]
MHTIPSEIILAISEHLRPVSSHRSTLLSLCLVDKRTYRLVKVQLYRHVELNSQGAITKFYQTLTSICPRNAIYVVALNVYPLKWDPNICSSDHARKDLVPQLRFILDSVPNLKHLHLSITRKALVLLLADLKPIFKLHTMAHSGDMSKPLLKFLGNQPTIVNHSWYGLSSWKMCRVLRENMNKNQRFLGNLQHATGPANFLAALMLCRPLTSITILIHTWRDGSSVGDNECTGPGETMGWTKHMYGAYKGGLNLIPPRESLREIRIAETQLEVGMVT